MMTTMRCNFLGGVARAILTSCVVLLLCSPAIGRTLFATSYGADPTGVKDSGPAISAMCAAARTLSIKPRLFIPGGNYLIQTPINATELIGMELYGEGEWATTLIGKTSGRPVLDLTGTAYSTVRDLRIVGSGTSSPNVGILGARSVASPVGYVKYRTIYFSGSFTLAAYCGINNELSVLEDCKVLCQGSDITPIGFLIDGKNKFNVQSPYKPIYLPGGHAYSGFYIYRCNVGLFTQSGGKGAAIHSIYSTGLTIRDCFLSSNQKDAAVILEDFHTNVLLEQIGYEQGPLNKAHFWFVQDTIPFSYITIRNCSGSSILSEGDLYCCDISMVKSVTLKNLEGCRLMQCGEITITGNVNRSEITCTNGKPFKHSGGSIFKSIVRRFDLTSTNAYEINPETKFPSGNATIKGLTQFTQTWNAVTIPAHGSTKVVYPIQVTPKDIVSAHITTFDPYGMNLKVSTYCRDWEAWVIIENLGSTSVTLPAGSVYFNVVSTVVK